MIFGVTSIPLEPHPDDRGSFTEVFRRSWDARPDPQQWNLMNSKPRVLRGMHVHLVHTDVCILLAGRSLMALRDFRHESPTFRAAEIVDMKAGAEAWVLPPGVGHAFYSLADSSLLIGVSHYWNTDDELGCRWDDPAIGIDWPDPDPLISERDRDASTVAALEEVTATQRFIA